jgi:Tol biopolymer transport system component
MFTDRNGATHDMNGRITFRTVSTGGEVSEPLFDVPAGTTYPVYQLSPDGKSLFYSKREGTTFDSGIVRLMRRELATGVETELYHATSMGVGLFSLMVSPDGSQLAFEVNLSTAERAPSGEPRAIVVLSFAGGAAREIYRGSYNCPLPTPGTWTRDGKFVLVMCSEDGGNRVLAVPVDGGSPSKLDLKMASLGDLSFSPDGRQLTFAASANGDRHVWSITNLLAGMK